MCVVPSMYTLYTWTFRAQTCPIPVLTPKYWTEQILYNFETHQTIPKPGSVFLLPTKISLPFVVGPQKFNSFKQADWTYMDLLKALHVAVPAMKLQAPWIPGEKSEKSRDTSRRGEWENLLWLLALGQVWMVCFKVLIYSIRYFFWF